MRINAQNLIWAATHPRRALRYLRHRDVIPYRDIALYLPAAPVILEAGAADGANTLEMAEYWPQSRIHAFEPVPSARVRLERRMQPFADRVHVYGCALGDAQGTFPMNISASNDDAEASQSSSLLQPTGHHREYDFVRFDKQIEVEVKTLDQVASEHEIEHIDFLWLDMQGYELKALDGAKHILPTVKAIHIEVQHVELYAGAPLASEVKAYLKARGFVPKIDATFRVAGNMLFVRNSS